MQEKILYVFLDESGDLNCSPTGSHNFVMAGVATPDPDSAGRCLRQLKYEFLAQNVDIPHFHSCQDKKGVQKRVLHTLHDEYFSHATAHVVWIDKHYAHPKVQPKIYSLVCSAMGKYIIKAMGSEYDRVVLAFDCALQGKKKTQALSSIKSALNEVSGICSYSIYVHSVDLDFNGQAADYLAHAKFCELEHGKTSQLGILGDADGAISYFDLFHNGTRRFY